MRKPKRTRQQRTDWEWNEEDERQSQEAAQAFFDHLYCWWKLVTGDMDKAREHYQRSIKRRQR